MKRKLLSLFTALAVLLSVLPAGVLAAPRDSGVLTGSKVKDGNQILPATLFFEIDSAEDELFEQDVKHVKAKDLGAFKIDKTNVTGTANYIEGWESFSSIAKEQSGYYLPLSISSNVEDSKVTVVGSKEPPFVFNNWPKSGDTLVMRLDDLTTKQFTVAVEKYGVTTEYAIDVSGVTFGEDPSIPKPTFEIDISDAPLFVGDTSGVSAKKLGKFEVDNTSTVPADTIKIKGTANYIENWDSFSSIEGEETGHYLPLKIKPGLSNCTVTVTGSKTDPFVFRNWNENGDTLVMRLDDLKNKDYKFTVKVENGSNSTKSKTYTIDCSSVVLAEDLSIPKLSLDIDKSTTPFFENDTIKSSDLGTFTGTESGNTFKVAGTAKYIENWTGFSSIAEEQTGNYLPLKIVPTLEGCTISVEGSKNIDIQNWPKAGDTLVMRLNSLPGNTFKVIVSKDGKKTEYTVDISDVNCYVVTFEANGGNIDSRTQNIKKGGKATAPTVTKVGHTLAGWYTDSEFKNKWNFDDVVTRDLTLYAKWEKKAGEYLITFDKNCTDDTVTITPSTMTTEAYKLSGKLPVPKRTGYYFEGWYLAIDQDGNPTGKPVTQDQQYKEDTTLYAKWVSKGAVPEDPDEPDDGSSTVTFDYQYDGKTEEVSVETGKAVEKPASPTRDGYTFQGWYKEKECKERWDFETDLVTGDVTLYACWEKIPVPGDSDYEYRVWVRYGASHGDVYTSRRYAEQGMRVTISVYPDSDYQVGRVEITQDSGGKLDWERDGREYTFIMPASDVTVNVEFDLRVVYNSSPSSRPSWEQERKPAVTPVFKPIEYRPASAMPDVAWNSWAYPAAQWAYQNGYLDTAPNGTFQLDGPVNHQQMWRIMAQWLGEPAMSDREIANWACKMGAGKGNSPAGAMTRQDMVAYLHQCYFLMGGDVSSTGNLSAYADSRLIPPASQKAWTWAVEKGIVTGTAGGSLNPNKEITRGEFAAMLMRLCQKLMG